jgi:hypothetical protein
MLIIERQGAIRLVAEGKLGAVDPMLFLDNVDAEGDRGSSGIAIDPRWPAKPYVYVYYECTDSTCKLVRYRAGGDLYAPSSLYLTLDPASRYDVLPNIPDLYDIHNGGTLRFGSDVDVNRLDPHFRLGDVYYSVYDRLTQYDINHVVQPMLAESWDIATTSVDQVQPAQGVTFTMAPSWMPPR